MPYLHSQVSNTTSIEAMSTKPEQHLSPAYSMSIPLSVPAGIFISWQFDFVSIIPHLAIAIAPALVVGLIAYFHTRARNRRIEG
jgi:hypothetical protein